MCAKARKPRFSATERKGVNAIEGIFLNDFGWIPRSQESSDMGIDSQVEVCVDGNPTGKLLAIQIKSGASFFGKTRGNSVVVRGKKVHYDYWINHSLPVLLVVHNPDTGETIWQHITEETVRLSGNGWETEIDRERKLSTEYSQEIAFIAEGPESVQRLRKLIFDRPLIETLANGCPLFLEFEEWVNKSLGRTPLTLKAYDEDQEERVLRETFLFYAGYTVGEMLCKSFPWADFEIDEDYYEENMDEESVRFMFGLRKHWDDIYPYTVAMCEVASYRLVLKLNKLGEGFLVTDEFLSQ